MALHLYIHYCSCAIVNKKVKINVKLEIRIEKKIKAFFHLQNIEKFCLILLFLLRKKTYL